MHVPKRAWVVFAAFALVGFLLATQHGAPGSVAWDLEQQSQVELTTLVGSLSREAERLRQEQVELRVRINDYVHEQETSQNRLTARERTLQELILVTGAAPAVGRGIEARIQDADGELRAYDLTLLLHELRSAGAEAVAVNGLRTSFRSAFTDGDQGVAMSGQPLDRPYVLTAVGDPDELRSALVMAGGVVASLEARPGVSISIEQERQLEMPAVTQESPFLRAVAVEEKP